MYRLTDDLARRRMTYPAPILGSPGVLLIDLPTAFRGPGLLLGRFCAAVIESHEEEVEMSAFLAAPRAGPVRPALLDRRPSAIHSDHALITHFEPPPALAGRGCISAAGCGRCRPILRRADWSSPVTVNRR